MVWECFIKQVDSRIQVLVLPNTRGQLPDNPGIQNQVMDEALVTWEKNKCIISLVSLQQWQILKHLNAVNTLTLIRFWRNFQHEREEVLQKLGVVVRKMQTFAVFPGEGELIRTFCTFSNTLRKSEIKRVRWDGHLGARNTCPEDSKELGSRDCISVTETVFHLFKKTNKNTNK